jgi:DNA-binding response OmpR family regulator
VVTARILLVEDELPLLQLVQKYLERQGFEVDPHSSSISALQSLKQAPDRYDLVMADLGLSDIRGDELLMKMLEIRPGLLGLICSGSEFFVSKFPPSLQHRVAFLQKPFLPKELAEAIHRLLARRNAPAPGSS